MYLRSPRITILDGVIVVVALGLFAWILLLAMRII